MRCSNLLDARRVQTHRTDKSAQHVLSQRFAAVPVPSPAISRTTVLSGGLAYEQNERGVHRKAVYTVRAAEAVCSDDAIQKPLFFVYLSNSNIKKDVHYLTDKKGELKKFPLFICKNRT